MFKKLILFFSLLGCAQLCAVKPSNHIKDLEKLKNTIEMVICDPKTTVAQVRNLRGKMALLSLDHDLATILNKKLEKKLEDIKHLSEIKATIVDQDATVTQVKEALDKILTLTIPMDFAWTLQQRLLKKLGDPNSESDNTDTDDSDSESE